jgi:hypothetical protein
VQHPIGILTKMPLDLVFLNELGAAAYEIRNRNCVFALMFVLNGVLALAGSLHSLGEDNILKK